MTFWSDECPQRGPGLTHAHWTQCDPNKGGHPGSIARHTWGQCCHCEHTEASWLRLHPADVIVQQVAPPVTGAPAQCTVSGGKHKPAVSTPLIGENGLEWPSCSSCGVQMEPSLATGALTGPEWGIGRGWTNPRMVKRWEAIAFRYRGAFG